MKKAEYIKGSSRIEDAPSKDPIFLLLGRSNVGKSSFINALTNRKNLARTSGTPGKTIALNYYHINEQFYLVDAPGYGYARRSRNMQDQFIVMIENILLNHPKIVSILLLIDFKVGPTQDDLDIYEFLLSLNLDVIVIATKMDKVPKTKRIAQKNKILQILDNPTFYSISNKNKENINNIRQLILERIENYESSFNID